MHLDCPRWEDPESDLQLPSVVAGLLDFQRFIYKNAKRHLLQHGDLKTWHGKIFERVVPLSYYAGHYRSDDPRRPCLQVEVHVGGRPGAPYKQVSDRMRVFSADMRDFTIKTDKYIAIDPAPVDRARAAVQLAALCAGKFIQIHPFVNGNGRMSRLIVNYMLYRYDYPQPCYAPYPRPDTGYAEASAACMEGDFVPLFHYLLALLASRMTT